MMAGLLEQQDTLIERWLAQVRPLAPRSTLSREQLVDNLPDFLAELGRALRELDDASVSSALPESSPVAQAHGRQRHQLGYPIGALAREYPLLQEVILTVAAERGVPLRPSESIVLARCMGTAASEALSQFFSQHETHLPRQPVNAQARQALAEEPLARDSEARLRAILASLEEGVTLHDASGTVHFANTAAARHTGLTLEQLAGRTPFDPRWRAVHEDGSEYPGHEHPHMRVLRTGQGVVGEVMGIHHPDGRLAWLSVNAQPLFEADGRMPSGAVSSFFDITQHKAAEAALRASEEHLREILAATGAGTFTLDIPTDVMRFDEQMWALAGQEGARPLSLTSAQSFVHPEDRAQVERVVGEALVPGGPAAFTYEHRVLTAKGAERWLSVRAAVKRAADGRPLRLMGTAVDISERKAAESALRESEERLRRVVAASGTGTWEFDPATERVGCDARHLELLGLPPDTQLTLSVTLAATHPEDRHYVSQAIGAALAGENQGRYITQYRTIGLGEGSERWVEAKGRVLVGADGKPLRLLGTSIDITARKRAEAEREQLLERTRKAQAEAEAERQKLHDIFVQAPFVIAILEGPEHTYTFANPAHHRLMGGRDVVGKPLMEALPDLTAQGFRTLLDGVVRSGIAYVGREVPIKLPHHGPAEVEYLNFVYQPLRDAQGRVRGVLSCGFEVTEQVLARKQAQALSAQLEAIFQSFPEPLYVADATGIIRTNAAGLSLLGAKSLEDLNRNITTLHEKVHARWADTGEPIAASDNQLLRALQGYTGFLDFIVRDLSTGKDRVLRSAAAPVWVGEQVVGAVSVNMDFTDRTLAERALRERAEFEQQLIGIVSHDLRNPLNAILLGVQGLLRREELDERGTRALLRIQSSSERAIRMVKDLLDFTQARLGGGIPVHPRPLKLHTFTRQVVEEVRASFPEREIEVEAQGEGEGSWDSDRLAQVVTNLLTNALKYSPEGTPVRVRTRGEGDWVELAVHNGGAPIPPEALGRLFLPLQRATADVDKAGRSVGLGLYIVKQLVEAHRGTIEVKSSAQEGTTFTVRLPRRAE